MLLDVAPDAWDATCCIATAALLWPYIGVQQAEKGKITVGEFFAGFLPFVALIGAIMAVNDAPKMDPPTGFDN